MAKEKISIKFLIHLVGERPALWDKTSDAYKDRALKDTSWREICTFITENYEHMQPDPKAEFTKMVMKKWTHIRDSWVKSMKYGYDEKTKLPPKPYVYHEDLKFMQKILKCKPRRYDFSVPKLDNSNYENFYSDKDQTQNSIPLDGNDDQDDDDDGIDNNQYEEHIENLKQENELLENGSEQHVIENHAELEEDDWVVDDAHTPIIEIKREPNHNIEINSKDQIKQQKQRAEQQQQQQRMKRQYTSIFRNSNRDEEDPCSSFSSNDNLNQNRHWHFFKGILPTINSLDEDHTLQFQAGIITLLQKLRNSQKQTQNPRSSKPTAKKRKNSDDEDYEWPIKNSDLNKRYSSRKSKKISDPIGGGNLEFESENSSDNE